MSSQQVFSLVFLPSPGMWSAALSRARVQNPARPHSCLPHVLACLKDTPVTGLSRMGALYFKCPFRLLVSNLAARQDHLESFF